MFQEDFNFFPTLREIRDQIIKAQINEIQEQSTQWDNSTRFVTLKKMYSYSWNMLFDLAGSGNLDQPLTQAILSDPNHTITKHILYIYSMESFIYEKLNQASRHKDKSQIQYYGAFAAALSYVIYSANQNRSNNQLTGVTMLYRGLKLTQEQVDSYLPGQQVHLLGYTSTSKSEEVG